MITSHRRLVTKLSPVQHKFGPSLFGRDRGLGQEKCTGARKHIATSSYWSCSIRNDCFVRLFPMMSVCYEDVRNFSKFSLMFPQSPHPFGVFYVSFINLKIRLQAQMTFWSSDIWQRRLVPVFLRTTANCSSRNRLTGFKLLQVILLWKEMLLHITVTSPHLRNDLLLTFVIRIFMNDWYPAIRWVNHKLYLTYRLYMF